MTENVIGCNRLHTPNLLLMRDSATMTAHDKANQTVKPWQMDIYVLMLVSGTCAIRKLS